MKLIYKIMKESVFVLILAAVISSLGGVGLMNIEDKLIIFIPLLILLPALSHMVGDFGIIMVSRFTTYLYEKRIRKHILTSKLIKHLFKDVLIVSILSSIYISTLATAVGYFKGFNVGFEFLLKLILITLTVTIFLIIILFLIAICGGFYIYKRKENPDNLLIPITTSIADLGSLILFSLLVGFFF